MAFHPFFNTERQLRNGWWIAVFFLVLAALVFPALLLARRHGAEVTPLQQAALVAVASAICQLMRRQPWTEVVGPLDRRWLAQLLAGGLAGSALMLAPALFLWACGVVRWTSVSTGFAAFPSVVVVAGGVALAEELLFRGFMFQRLVAGIGVWPAQVLMAAYFLLTHLGNPHLVGTAKLLGSVNIFLASILFGLAYLRTRRLALPIGLHFMANLTQGGILGFGVSGAAQAGLFAPHFAAAPDWVTGGQFGLEASAPGLGCLVVAIVLLHRWQPESAAARGGTAVLPAGEDHRKRRY